MPAMLLFTSRAKPTKPRRPDSTFSTVSRREVRTGVEGVNEVATTVAGADVRRIGAPARRGSASGGLAGAPRGDRLEPVFGVTTAPEGHTSAQAPHDVQSVWSITAQWSRIEIAPLLHASMQTSQPLHKFLSIWITTALQISVISIYIESSCKRIVK